jgi:anti-sigma regulatory factor (Ser/Thr protein kinase)
MTQTSQPDRPTAVAGEPASSPVRHEVALHATAAEGAALALSFLHRGLLAGEPIVVAVSPPIADLLLPAVAGSGGLVEFAEIAAFGRNPGRIIATVWDLLSNGHGQPVWCIQEPLWPGRTPAEVTEVLRHEALVNLAFPGGPLSLLCLYPRQLLTESGMSDTRSTHPTLRTGDGVLASGSYLGAGVLPAQCLVPLKPPPAAAASMPYSDDLREVRRRAAAVAEAAGLAADRVADLVLAVSEVAANTLRHTHDSGTLLAWHTADEVICEIRDCGTLTDPLAGRRRPAKPEHGHGLWVVNQLCDLVELRAGPAQTTVRMHMSLAE